MNKEIKKVQQMTWSWNGRWTVTTYFSPWYTLSFSLADIIIWRQQEVKRDFFFLCVLFLLDQFYLQCQQEWGANMMIGADKRLSKAATHQSGSKVGQFRSQPQCNAQTRFFCSPAECIGPNCQQFEVC